MATTIRQLLAAECRRQRIRLLVAGASAALVAATAVLLLGLSGWFITGAALAGLAGPAAAGAFNYLLPSAAIRLLAILRTGSRYAERLVGHDAALRAMARIRPALFAALAAAPPTQTLAAAPPTQTLAAAQPTQTLAAAQPIQTLAAAQPIRTLAVEPPIRTSALSTGEATARMVQDVDAIEAKLVRHSARWGMAASLATGIALLLLAGPGPAIATAAVFAASTLLAHWLAEASQAPGRDVQRAAGALKDDFATLAAAAAELRAYGLEGWAADRIDTRSQALAAAQLRVTAGAGWFDLLQAVAVGLAAMSALALSAGQPLPMAALAALGAAMTVEGTAGFARGLERRGATREAALRLDAMLARAGTDTPMPDSPRAGTMLHPPAIQLFDATPLTPGTIVGLTGPSGCGKTTLLETLLRLRAVAPGQIGLGGLDLARLEPAAARACFALAPQDPVLLAGTLRETLLLADPTATDAALWNALHDAALDLRVAALPQGLDSWLGENGARLSGGEKRRLVLARALLRPAPWLLLDEPSEGLDAATEALLLQRLQARLRRLRQGALIVTHRPAPLAICDRVLLMRQGRVVRSDQAWGDTAA